MSVYRTIGPLCFLSNFPSKHRWILVETALLGRFQQLCQALFDEKEITHIYTPVNPDFTLKNGGLGDVNYIDVLA